MCQLLFKWVFEIVYSVCATDTEDDAIIWHTQIRQGMAPHITNFKWISESTFMDTLTKVFYGNIGENLNGTIEAVLDGTSDIYICKKKL